MKIIDFALEMEGRNRDLYRNLADQATGDGARRVFSAMVREEEGLMEEIRALQAKGEDVDSPVLEGVRKADKVLEAESAVLRDDLEAYRYLIGMERKMCRIFNAAAERESGRARDLLGRVAAVECGELRELESVYDFVNAPNEYLAWREFSNLDEFHNFGRYEDNRGCRHSLGN